jgi:hypothetical protein
MAVLASGFLLAENEKLVMEIEAELWATSSNPIARILGEIKRLIFLLLGSRKIGFLIITDKRVIEIATQIKCWCITTSRDIKYVPMGSINEVGYTRQATCGFFCPAFHLYYRTTALLGLKNNVLLKSADEAEALKAANAFYAAIANATM